VQHLKGSGLICEDQLSLLLACWKSIYLFFSLFSIFLFDVRYPVPAVNLPVNGHLCRLYFDLGWNALNEGQAVLRVSELGEIDLKRQKNKGNTDK